jgi:hypothetical protein
MRAIALAWLVLAGCAGPRPDYMKPAPQPQPQPVSRLDKMECEYEAKQASTPTVTSRQGLGAAIGAAAAREAELYNMCMRLRAERARGAARQPQSQRPVICEKAADGIVDCKEAP